MRSIEMWHNWFAWRPVRCLSGKIIWLRRIWRRQILRKWQHHDHQEVRLNTKLHAQLLASGQFKASTYQSVQATLARIRGSK